MQGRRRYVASAVYLLLSVVPVLYGAFSVMTFLDPDPVRIGGVTQADWGWLALGGLTLAFVVGGWAACRRKAWLVAWALLALAYLPLIFVAATTTIFYGL